jgi:hypothetical protein
MLCYAIRLESVHDKFLRGDYMLQLIKGPLKVNKLPDF